MTSQDFNHARQLLARALPALTPPERQWVAQRLRGELGADLVPSLPKVSQDSASTLGLNHLLVLDSCLRRLQQKGSIPGERAANALFSQLLALVDEMPVPVARAGACVCLNVTRREVGAIEHLFQIWSLLMAGKHADPEADLALVFDREDVATFQQIQRALAKYELARHFGKIQIIDVDLPESENFYYRQQSEVPDSRPFAYGWKSGPNQQFFRLLRHSGLQGYAELLVVETDCYPVSPDWMEQILADARGRPDFWVLGSPFRGRSKVGPDILLHLNGVAVYRPGEPRFFSMLAQWETRLRNLCTTHPETAYDCAQELYFAQKLKAENWHSLTAEDVEDYYDYRRMFVMTDRIVNLAGEPERQGVGRYTLAEAMTRFPQARLFHANYLSEEVTRMAEAWAHDRS